MLSGEYFPTLCDDMGSLTWQGSLHDVPFTPIAQYKEPISVIAQYVPA